jgi:hypothetical protein
MRYMICDLETAPIADADTYLEAGAISAPANYKDPVKIAAYIAEEMAKQIDRCSLDPDLCRIVALGFAGEQGEPVVWTCEDETAERTAIASFFETWRAWGKPEFVTYNGIGFDLPIIERRALYLRVPAPELQLDKYRHRGVIDLQQVLSKFGAFKFRSLSFYTNRFALPAVDDDVSGKDIGALVRAGEWPTVANHCTADVLRTRHLAQRMGVVPVRDADLPVQQLHTENVF